MRSTYLSNSGCFSLLLISSSSFLFRLASSTYAQIPDQPSLSNGLALTRQQLLVRSSLSGMIISNFTVFIRDISCRSTEENSAARIMRQKKEDRPIMCVCAALPTPFPLCSFALLLAFLSQIRFLLFAETSLSRISITPSFFPRPHAHTLVPFHNRSQCCFQVSRR